MPGGVHTPLHLPQVRQDQRRKFAAPVKSAFPRVDRGGVASSNIPRARLRFFRQARVDFFFRLIAFKHAAHANRRADSSSFTRSGITNPQIQAGEVITAQSHKRPRRVRRIDSSFRVNHLLTCRADWRPRQGSLICCDMSSTFTSQATTFRQTHEHTGPACPPDCGPVRGGLARNCRPSPTHPRRRFLSSRQPDAAATPDLMASQAVADHGALPAVQGQEVRHPFTTGAR